MRLGKLVLGASIVLSSVASAQAGTVTSTWSNWAAAAHPGYAATGLGTFTPDATSQFPVTLSIDNSGKLYGGLFGQFYYTGAADADFVLGGALQSGDVSNLTLSINSGGYSFTELPTLSIGGQSYAFDTQTVTPSGTLQGFATQLYTFNWDLSKLGSGSFAGGSQYEIDWQYNAHVAFTEINAAQVSAVSAVPEPGSHAMILAGLAGVGAMARRRRGRRVDAEAAGRR